MTTTAAAPRPPADRPPGKSGLRGFFSGFVALAAVFALRISNIDDGDPEWARFAYIGAAAAMAGAALALWTARHRFAPVAAAGMVVAAIAGIVLTDSAVTEHRRHAETEAWPDLFGIPDGTKRITAKQGDSIREGATRQQIRRILGPTPGHEVERVVIKGRKERLPCVVYLGPDVPRRNETLYYSYCFRHGRYLDTDKL